VEARVAVFLDLLSCLARGAEVLLRGMLVGKPRPPPD
jgi:hypothetical protein